eukprot:6796038-Ditylum_brightwellii.AAC.1
MRNERVLKIYPRSAKELICIIGAISLINVLIERTSLAAVDNAICSASVVLKAILLLRQLNQ